MKVLAQYPLDAFNTFGFPAVAQFFAQIDSEEDLLAAVALAKTQQLKIHVLSGGSNILIAPTIEGLVLYINIQGLVWHDDHTVVANAGENWHALVAASIAKGLSGIESLALIPGKVGAAPVQNIGAYGTELGDVLIGVRAFDMQRARFVTLSTSECGLAYRDSVFKRHAGQYVITQITLQLQQHSESACQYPAVLNYLASTGVIKPSPEQVFHAVVALRQQKLPDPMVIGNAGSFFKNPVVSQSQYAALKERYPNMVAFPAANNTVKLAAGWLIDHAGWKGKQIGMVGVHHEQALVLTHAGGSTRQALLQLADQIQADIADLYGIQLEIEPQRFPL